jgi:hypothetical protein
VVLGVIAELVAGVQNTLARAGFPARTVAFGAGVTAAVVTGVTGVLVAARGVLSHPAATVPAARAGQCAEGITTIHPAQR